MTTSRNRAGRALCLSVLLAWSFLAWGCGGGSSIAGGGISTAPLPGSSPVAALDAANTNLVFVVTPDLAHNAGDINPRTANLSCQGLQRALRMATYLHETLLGSASVNGIYALEPATRLQTSSNLPDMVPLEVMEQFAMLNAYSETFRTPPPAETVIAGSFPINISYTAESLPVGAAPPAAYHPGCQGIDFADRHSGNEALVDGILARQAGGFHVFALPFETFQSLIGNLKTLHSYGYDVPTAWQGPNTVYVLAVPPAAGGSGASSITLTAYDAGISPGQVYPVLTPTYQHAPNNLQAPFVIQPATVAGSSVPGGINTNQTVHFVRHGEAHPSQAWEDGNLIMPGNWRALYLPTALAGVIRVPDYVYAVDPAQFIPGVAPSGDGGGLAFYSYVRTSQTVAPYAIANGVPFCVASGVQWSGTTSAENNQQVEAAVSFFFTGGTFSNKTLLVAWEHDHIPPIAQALVNRYFPDPASAPTVPSWPGNDYDTIWTFALDAQGRLVISNPTCEGINSATLPSTPPAF